MLKVALHLYDGLIKAKAALNLTIEQLEEEKKWKHFFFFFENKFLKKADTALASHGLLLLQFKCNAAS